MTTPLAPGDRQLTANFRLSEFAVSASHPHLVRPVPDSLRPNVQRVANSLQIIRDDFGYPIEINSGYRSAALNDAVDGSPTSQHRKAQAADIRPGVSSVTAQDLMEVILHLVGKGKLPDVGQFIYYPDRGFVHVATTGTRFPKPTACIHWPEKGYKYRPFRPTVRELHNLLGLHDQ